VFLFVIGLKIDNPFLYPIFLYFNYWLTYYFDPDDDLSGMSSSEGRIQRDTKKINILFGLIGAIVVGYKNVYAYFAGLFGGHRSWFSHKVPFSMIGRMLVYNFGLFYFLYGMFGYMVDYYNLENADFQYELYLDIWLMPYLTTQFFAFLVQDVLHIMLDIRKDYLFLILLQINMFYSFIIVQLQLIILQFGTQVIT